MRNKKLKVVITKLKRFEIKFFVLFRINIIVLYCSTLVMNNIMIYNLLYFKSLEDGRYYILRSLSWEINELMNELINDINKISSYLISFALKQIIIIFETKIFFSFLIIPKIV